MCLHSLKPRPLTYFEDSKSSIWLQNNVCICLQSRRWSNASTLILTHKIVTTRRPENINKSMVMPFLYPTRRATEQQIWTWAGTIRGHNQTAISMRTFMYQGIALYNSIPNQHRNYNHKQFKGAVKKWASLDFL